MLSASHCTVHIRTPASFAQVNCESRRRPRRVALHAGRTRLICGATAKSGRDDAAAQVRQKVDQALQQVQDAQKEVEETRQRSHEEAEQRRKDQRFDRAKDALHLKDQGYKLEPSAGHDQAEDLLEDSKEARTHENASSQEAQVPNPSISKSVRERLLALEEIRATKPFRKLISRGEPVPQLTHHYAAAAWWAIS